jgi:hypothetical protein
MFVTDMHSIITGSWPSRLAKRPRGETDTNKPRQYDLYHFCSLSLFHPGVALVLGAMFACSLTVSFQRVLSTANTELIMPELALQA